jgi:opacity protein-like surface antigen
MKNLTLSLIAITAIGTSLMADTYPADGPKSYAAQHQEGTNINSSNSSIDNDNNIVNNGFYLGGGLASLRIGANNIASTDVDARASVYGLSLLGGYEFNKNIAVEGRFSFNIQDWGDAANDTTDFSLFVKPMYPVNDVFSVYGLLGFGNIKLKGNDYTDSDSGFQWGLGASASMQNNISAFIDYTMLWNDNQFDEEDLGSENLVIDVITVGLIYKF